MTELEKLPQEGPALSLIEKAIERGVDAAQLEKLVGLAERFAANRAREAYQRAMNDCQKELPAVVKNKQGQNSKYAQLETINDAIVPVFTKHGFSLSFDTADSTPGVMRITCDVMHVAGHKETKHLDLAIDKSGSMNQVQGHGSTVSYGRRYLTCMVFNVSLAGEDTDAGQAALRITEEQEFAIAALIDSTETNAGKFLAWANISKLSDMTPKFFPTALDFLKRKQAKAAKEAKGAAS